MSWLDEFLQAYNRILSNGQELPKQQKLNFTNATVVDDPANQRTNVTVATLTTPSGTGFVHVTGGVVDGAATSVSLSTQVAGTLPLASLAHGTAGQLLATNAAGVAPAWVTVLGDVSASVATPGVMSVVSITGAGGVCDITCDELDFAGAGDSIIRSASNLILISALSPDDSITIGAEVTFGVDIPVVIRGTELRWASSATRPHVFQDTRVSDDEPNDMSIGAQSAWPSAVTWTSGAVLSLHGGSSAVPGTTGKRGAVRLTYKDNLIPMVEVTEIAPNRRVTALCQTSGAPGVTATQIPGSGGDGMVFVWDASIGPGPGSNPVGGYLLYSSGGALMGRGGSGTTTTIGPAEPHCPVCGTDFGVEWSNPTWGVLQVCMSCLSDELGDRPWIRRVR